MLILLPLLEKVIMSVYILTFDLVVDDFCFEVIFICKDYSFKRGGLLVSQV